jgi:hypothetical protein
MEYYRSIHLECAELLRAYTENYALTELKDFPGTVTSMPLLSPLDTILNDELKSRNISKSRGYKIFKRKITDNTIGKYHIDGNAPDNFIFNCSIVIPVSGCKGTEMIWCNDNYSLDYNVSPYGVKYFDILWNKPPETIIRKEIFETPMLCRVDIPHTAISNGLEERITFTFRLDGNETFEELCEKFK